MKVQPEYEKVEEFNEIVEKIQDAYMEEFAHIDPSRLSLWKIINKEQSESKQTLWQGIPVKEPVCLQCSADFFFIVYYNVWDELSDKHKYLLIVEMLRSIPSDGSKSLVPCDIKGYRTMLKTFGVDYLNNPDIPDILEESIEWK